MARSATSRADAIHVTIDAGPLYGHRTGVGVATAGMLAALEQRDDVVLDPYLVSFRSRPHSGHRRLPLPGIVASHLWARTDLPRLDRWAGEADVVHGTNYVVPPTRRPSVISVYDCWFLRHPDEASPLARRAGQRLRRAVAGGAWVHASSEATAEHVRNLLGSERVVSIPLGLPPAPPPLADLPVPDAVEWLGGRRFIVAIGTEERRKDLPLLIDAYALLTREHSDIALVLTGAEGDDSAAITAAIGRVAGADSRILRLGPVDDGVKHALLRRAAVLAYPSRDEGFGFPILEAQLAGTPLVASEVGAIPEIAGDGGALLVSDRDPAQFAAALVRAVDDDGTRLGLIKAGQRNVDHYSWETTGASLVALYARAIGAGS